MQNKEFLKIKTYIVHMIQKPRSFPFLSDYEQAHKSLGVIERAQARDIRSQNFSYIIQSCLSTPKKFLGWA
jgi:hypothetical protein